MNDLRRYIFKLKLNSKPKVALECFYVLLTVVAAMWLSSHFGVFLKRLTFLSPNIEMGVVSIVFLITAMSHVAYAYKYEDDSEIIFLRSLGFNNWKLHMMYAFKLRFQIYFQVVLIIACVNSISLDLFVMFVLLYASLVFVFLNVVRRGLIPDKFISEIHTRRVLSKGSSKLMALIKNDLNIAGKIIEIKLFCMIYVLLNVILFKSSHLLFNVISLFYVFLVSLTAEKFFVRNRELKSLYKVLGIEFKQFYISKLVALCVIALVPVMFFLSLKTVFGVISVKFWLMTVVLNILISLSFTNYWVSVFTRFWEGTNAFFITFFAFSMFIPPFIYIVPVALHKRSYMKWGGGF